MLSTRSAWGPRLARAAALCAASLAAASAVAASSSIDMLLREARAHAAAHEESLALRRYMEALQLDPTCAEAYVGLGAVREQVGDVREAERVYTVALAHVPSLTSALAARARVRRALGRRLDAAEDMQAYALLGNDVAALRELAGWYAEDGLLSAELAAWRRMLAIARARSDGPLAGEARVMVRALQIVVGPSDPVTSPPADTPIRHALAQIARRGG